MGRLRRARRATQHGDLAQAGDLLPVEAIDRSGVVVTSEGAFVRILHVVPPNPLTLSGPERERLSAAYGELVARLRPGESLQFYAEARPVDLEQILGEARREVVAWAGDPPGPDHPARDPLALARWRLYAAMEESLSMHADDHAAVAFDAYVVIPFVPRQAAARALLGGLVPWRGGGLPSAPLERDLRAHRRALRESLAQADGVRTVLDSLGLPTRLLNGEEIARLLWARFNPTTANTRRRRPPQLASEVHGEIDAVSDRDDARRAARRIRELLAASTLDFKRSKRYAEIDDDAEQAIFAATTADATSMGWLFGTMLTRQPYSVSVHVAALDRRRERRRLKLAYRRLFSVNRGAEMRGRVPNLDRYAQEQETQRLLGEMAGHERTGLFRVSIYQALRSPGPTPDLAALAEAVDYCADQMESMSDCRVNRGEYQQAELWQSTLPLGRDVAGRTRRYATRNVGDTIPLVGMGCGSPRGIPFAFSDPGRTLERLDPYDRTHSNFTMVVSGRSGSGKTLTANVILARCIAQGARAFVLDRAGHYETLTRLVPGAREVDIGAGDSPHAVNPWDVPEPGQVSHEKVAFLVSLHAVMMGDEGLTTLERAQLGAAIRGVYARSAETGAPARESMLRDELLARAESERSDGAPDIAVVLRNLAERLGEYCGEGAYAYLLDRETTVAGDSPLVVFDTRRCPEVVLRPVMFALIEYITRAVERHRDAYSEVAGRVGAPMFTGRTVLLIDEAWHLVGRRETGEFANDVARRARHLGLFLIVMSQHLSDFSTEHGLALLRNATMQLFLAQHPDEIPFVQEAMRLSDEEAGLIARLKTVKGSHAQMFWVNGTRGRGRVALRLGPTEYWCHTSDPLEDVPRRDAAVAERDGDVWAGIGDIARGAGAARPPAPAEGRA
jgi:hypothetical protein